MMREDIWIGIGVFIAVVLVFEGVYFTLRNIQTSERKRVRRRLKSMSNPTYGGKEIDILRKRDLSQIPWFNRLLLRVTRLREMDLFLEQAGARYPLGVFVLLSVLLGAIGFILGNIISSPLFVKLSITFFLAWLPFFYLYMKKRKRMAKFLRQLPDALDLIARSLKAGHAFTGGLKIVAEEMEDPVGTEFGKTLAEINFGIGVPEAMRNLTARVDCQDVNFFAIAVIIQRETGGNLAEIIENISQLIRERFVLQGRIRILSAEMRLSAVILTSLPFLIAFYFFIVQPRYIRVLINDPAGRIMIMVAAILMGIGVFIMNRMVRFRV
jgi:tight adherence protein B